MFSKACSLMVVVGYAKTGNEGMCGIAPNGVSVFRKAGSADAEQVYSLGGPCPVDITSTSTASAAGNSGSVRVDAAITGVASPLQMP